MRGKVTSGGNTFLSCYLLSEKKNTSILSLLNKGKQLSIYKASSHTLAYVCHYSPVRAVSLFPFFLIHEKIKAQISVPKNMCLLYCPGSSMLSWSNKNSKFSVCNEFLFLARAICSLCVCYGTWHYMSFKHAVPALPGKLLLVLEDLDQASYFLENLSWIWLKMVLNLMSAKFSSIRLHCTWWFT